MLSNVAKLIVSPVQSTKEILLKNNMTYFDNLDEDVYDEIIQVTTTGYNEDTRLKINLYKNINGQYKLADNYLGEYDVDTQIQGIYNYDKGVPKWFKVYDGTDTKFNEYEKSNYKLIQQWENKK